MRCEFEIRNAQEMLKSWIKGYFGHIKKGNTFSACFPNRLCKERKMIIYRGCI